VVQGGATFDIPSTEDLDTLVDAMISEEESVTVTALN
jgi:hypothetical protein